jgi:hypothetical protein
VESRAEENPSVGAAKHVTDMAIVAWHRAKSMRLHAMSPRTFADAAAANDLAIVLTAHALEEIDRAFAKMEE